MGVYFSFPRSSEVPGGRVSLSPRASARLRHNGTRKRGPRKDERPLRVSQRTRCISIRAPKIASYNIRGDCLMKHLSEPFLRGTPLLFLLSHVDHSSYAVELPNQATCPIVYLNIVWTVNGRFSLDNAVFPMNCQKRFSGGHHDIGHSTKGVCRVNATKKH